MENQTNKRNYKDAKAGLSKTFTLKQKIIMAHSF